MIERHTGKRLHTKKEITDYLDSEMEKFNKILDGLYERGLEDDE